MPPNEDNWFLKQGLTPPTRTPHGVSLENMADKLKPLKAHSWRLEGNKLIATTDFGELVNYISTDYILKGTGEDGLPILEKV